MPNPTVIDLDALLDSSVVAKIDGKDEPLHPLDGIAYHKLTNAGDSPSVQLMYEIAGGCLPTVSQDRVMKLTPAQVGAILKKAREMAENVEALASPNSAPAGKRGKARE